MKYDLITVRSTREPYKVSSPIDVYAALKRYATSKVEKFFAISLDGQHTIIHINMVSIGTTNRCMAVPRDVFHAAVKDQATALLVAHCHPSGNNSRRLMIGQSVTVFARWATSSASLSSTAWSSLARAIIAL